MDRYNNPIYRMISPAPGMYRTGFEEIYRQGVTPQALKDMASRLYNTGLSNAEQWALINNHPNIQQYINQLRTLQQYNQMRNNPDYGRYTGI